MKPLFTARRAFIAALAASALLGCSTPAQRDAAPPPIVFVHGNGDSAALWLTTLWRFESNGWPRERLVALDHPLPLARDDDTKEQPGRSSSTEHAQWLAQQVDAVLARTGTRQVVLVGNSRGGNAIRNYIQNHGGAAKVSHAVLGGTPNHGVWAVPNFRPNNEFNGAGPFLKGLNAPKGPNGDEVTPGLKWLTLRSNGLDKFAQPDGEWIGAKGTATNVSAEGPALKGALNVVLPGRDHREVSYHPDAFVHTYEFITGRAPATRHIVPEASAQLSGLVSGTGPAGITNQPLAGAKLEVYVVDAATGLRKGAAVYRQDVGADGRWGPYAADPKAHLEFVLGAPGYDTLHLYRSPFARSSSVVNLRAERLPAADRKAAAVVSFTRPRGYFGVPRDELRFDGLEPPPGVPAGVPGVASSRRVLLEGAGRAVTAEFNGERLVGRAWPAAEGRLTVLELQH